VDRNTSSVIPFIHLLGVIFLTVLTTSVAQKSIPQLDFSSKSIGTGLELVLDLGLFLLIYLVYYGIYHLLKAKQRRTQFES
jgi:hypothetical protein